ncbi:uncharacterized protein LOC122891489 isoform X1 [Neovison vison]|uniref:uncharacterized protein LOC122891489 isoform X1 n=1 Tax=Neovison vison TaxID=452646 RepID=UPI001CEFEAED|nr:uncharacterized protein LOC122891489 isoform X1 [Neogale vison]
MEKDYNPQNSTVLSKRKTGLRMRSKGDWPGSAKAATRGAAACAGSVLCGRICVGSGVCCHLSRPEARPQRMARASRAMNNKGGDSPEPALSKMQPNLGLRADP